MKWLTKEITISLMILFAFYTFLMQCALPDFVLCVGEGGHLALEHTEVQLHCRYTQNITSFATSIEVHSSNWRHNEACIDIALSTNLTSAFVSNNKQLSTPFIDRFQLDVIPFISSLTNYVFSTCIHDLAPSNRLNTLRSVILLI